jgi:hypothetical protein
VSPSLKRVLGVVALAAFGLGVFSYLRFQAPSVGNQRRELDRWCADFEEAAAKFPDDPRRAYAQVAESEAPRWFELMKTNAGLGGIIGGQRYPLALRFARRDFHVDGWACPELDRLALRIAALEPSGDGDLSKDLKILVTRDGAITVDGAPTSLEAFVASLPTQHEKNRHVVLYREGWQATTPHPTGARVLDALIAEDFRVHLVPARPE